MTPEQFAELIDALQGIHHVLFGIVITLGIIAFCFCIITNSK